MSEPVAPELLAHVHANFMEFWRTLAQAVPGGGVLERDGLLCVATGVPMPFFNPALARRLPADPAAAVARAVAFHRDLGAPLVLYTLDPVSAALAPTLEAAGLLPAYQMPGLLLAPLPAHEPPPPAGLTIEPVRDLAGLAVFNQVGAIGSEFPPGSLASMDGTAWLDTPDLTLYLGYADGQPVATAARLVSHGLAGVFAVSVLPEYRRRGIGEAITWRATLGDGTDGRLAASLQASELGYPVFRRMGYRHIVNYQAWLPR